MRARVRVGQTKTLPRTYPSRTATCVTTRPDLPLISVHLPASPYISLHQGYVSDDQPDLMGELGKPAYPHPHPDPNPNPNPDLTLTLTLSLTVTLTRTPTLTR